ncbi:MAG: toprim domain-containing protein [Parcubacteria group bacterium]
MKNEITIKDYLNQKGVEFKEANNELITACLFNDCDKDSGNNERHLYFNAETGQHHCKKCGASGNLATLIKHFGDDIKPAQIKKQVKIAKPQNKKLDPSIVENCHNTIPDRIRKYLNDRGITNEIIEKKKLGWGRFYSKNWITIPITNIKGEYTFFKLRKDPDDSTNKTKYKVFPTGNKAEIYGRDNLTEPGENLVICEGEFDCMILEKFGIPAITSTAGAETFKKEWLSELENFKCLYVVLDKDEAGMKGADKLIALLGENLPRTDICRIIFPKRMTDGKDISDYFNRYNGNRDEFIEELSQLTYANSLKTYPDTEEKKKERFQKLTPENKTSIETWEKTIKENFPGLLVAAKAGLSTIAQLLIEDIKNPFALVYVDVPSSGKTIVLNFFSTVKELAYTTDDFTPAAFVSHAANRKREDLEKNDLLPKLQYKALLIRDMAPIFAKRDEDVQAMLGILIRVLDGEGYENNSGVHGKRGYVGDYLFMILAASTPIRSRIWKIMGSLGSRLFFLNINGVEKSEAELANQLKIPCRDKEIACREVTKEFIKTLWNKYPDGVSWDMECDDIDLMKTIARLAKILAKLRTTINIIESSSGEERHSQIQIIKEMPDRLNQLIYNLTRGHALVYGRKNMTEEDLEMAIRITIDSAPPSRAKIFIALIRNNGHLATNEVMEILGSSRPVALNLMKEMVLLGIVSSEGDLRDEAEYYGGRPENKIILRHEHDWFISDDCKKIIERSFKDTLLTKSDAVLEEYDKK